MIAQLDYPDEVLYILAETEIEKTKRANCSAKEPETVDWLRSIPRDSVLYDIGANVGSYTLIAASRGLEVVAFEPSVPNFKRLNENLRLNGFKVKTICPPLWSHHTEIEWTYSSQEPGAALHSAKQGTGRLAFPLDHWVFGKFPLPQPTHLKIDVDGCELEVLQGAQNTLRGVQSLLVETDRTQPSHVHIRPLLEDWGFQVESIHPHGKSPVANVTFTRRSL